MKNTPYGGWSYTLSPVTQREIDMAWQKATNQRPAMIEMKALLYTSPVLFLSGLFAGIALMLAMAH